MRISSMHMLTSLISVLAAASVVAAKPYSASGVKQPLPTDTLTVDTDGTSKFGPAIGTGRPLDPTGTYKQGIAALDSNSHPEPIRARRDAEPDPTFFTARSIPDGIYPAGGVYPVYGSRGVARPLRPTGIFTTGSVPDGIYPTSSLPVSSTHAALLNAGYGRQPLRPTGIFTIG